MSGTLLAALVAVPTLVACAHRPQSFENFAPESAPQASEVRPDVARGTATTRRAHRPLGVRRADRPHDRDDRLVPPARERGTSVPARA